jgi:putative Holliday junction resolvase
MSSRFREGTMAEQRRRLLGIDYGSKRIGLAISDPEGRVAVPLETFARTDDRGAARTIARVAAREGVGGLVVGEPRRLDGGRGEAALRAARFARRLEAATGLPVELVDESLTSVEAERRLREAGVDAAAASGRVDAVAAQILLEEVLARRRSS